MYTLPKIERFNQNVLSKYHIYNSVFITLPFDSVDNTGVLLPIFTDVCDNGFKKQETIIIAPNTSGVVALSSNSNFILSEAGPSPAIDNFSFKFNSPLVTSASFKVFNILGKEVYGKNLVVKSGENSVKLSTKNLAAGVYIFTVKNGPYSLTRRFVVGNK